MATFPAAVEAWRPLVEEYAGDMPVNFLLACVRFESFGNPCALGKAGVEAGLFQLYFPDDARFGATFQQLRAGCSGAKLTRTLTDDERVRQVRTGCVMETSHRTKARNQVASNGLSWTEDTVDFWKLVKIQHGLPAVPKSFLPAYARTFGGPPASFAVWGEWVLSLSRSEVGSIDSGVDDYTAVLPDVFNNATKTGDLFASVQGGLSSLSPSIGLEQLLGVALGYALARFLGPRLAGVAMR